MTPPNDGTMVVLIGGRMTVDDGVRLDTRQRIESDVSDVMAKSLGRSWLWWSTVSSFVLPVLAAAGPEAYALITGAHTVAEVRADGSLRRTGLRGLLHGGVGKVTLVRPEVVVPVDTALPPEYGDPDVVFSEPQNVRWRFLEGNDFYLTRIRQRLSPTLVVDSSGSTEFDRHVSQRFRGDPILVVPHTYVNEIYLRRSAKRRADKPRSPYVAETFRPPWTPEAPPNPLDYTQIVPIEANFRVTGLIRGELRESPEDLEAARSLLESRYDLKIGLWDLVNNRVLRQTLLDTSPVSPAPRPKAQLPKTAVKRATEAVAMKQDDAQQGKQALGQLRPLMDSLRRAGWVDAEGNWPLALPLTEPGRLWPGNEPEVLLKLYLTINKRSTHVAVFDRCTEYQVLQRYLDRCRAQLEQIAEAGLPRLDVAEIWREKSGWGDNVDWETRFAKLAAKTEQWVPLMAEHVARCRTIQARTEQERIGTGGRPYEEFSRTIRIPDEL